MYTLHHYTVDLKFLGLIYATTMSKWHQVKVWYEKVAFSVHVNGQVISHNDINWCTIYIEIIQTFPYLIYI